MLSPDGRWLLVVTSKKGSDRAASASCRKYVTESGYEEFEESACASAATCRTARAC